MITTVSKTTIGAILSGVAGLCFLSYFIFSGCERRSNQVIKSNRLKKRMATKEDSETNKLAAIELKLPVSIKLYHIDQEIFLKEVDMGEFYLSLGYVDIGVQHLANAIISCHNPDVLYNVLRNRLPEHVFEKLTKKLSSEQLEVWSSSDTLESGHG